MIKKGEGREGRMSLTLKAASACVRISTVLRIYADVYTKETKISGGALYLSTSSSI
jgi:hypothetical protein